MPTKDEREVTIELDAWVKLPMKLRLRVKGEPHDKDFEVSKVLWALPRCNVEMGIQLDDLRAVKLSLASDGPFWELQDDLRADEGWDDEEPE